MKFATEVPPPVHTAVSGRWRQAPAPVIVQRCSQAARLCTSTGARLIAKHHALLLAAAALNEYAGSSINKATKTSSGRLAKSHSRRSGGGLGWRASTADPA